ncbi:hypothetical protein FKM82_019046 [Ascaphus truei]
MDEKQSKSDKMIANLKQKYKDALKEITVSQQEVPYCHRELEVSQNEVHALRIELNASHLRSTVSGQRWTYHRTRFTLSA